MVDWNGNWTAEKNYNGYPEDKWCDYDYIANWIIGLGYNVKTSIENLTMMVFAHYDNYLEDNDVKFYTDRTESENDIMISVEDVACFVEESGGLCEFDYYC